MTTPPDAAPAWPRRDHRLTAEVWPASTQAPTGCGTLMQDLVRHLHAFVLENDLTEDEWRTPSTS